MRPALQLQAHRRLPHRPRMVHHAVASPPREVGCASAHQQPAMSDSSPNSAGADQPLPPLPPPPDAGYHRLEEVQDIEADADGTVRWWKPGWDEIWKQIG